jgi:hypothetical protein
VSDDLPLRNQFTQWLVSDLARSPLPELDALPIEATGELPEKTNHSGLRLVTLTLRPEQPDLQKQIAEWLSHRRGRIDRSQIAFQIVGIESLTGQSAATQRQFLNSLRALGRHYAQWDLNLVLWVTKPRLHAIRQSAPEFWRWYTGIFDFSGQPQVAENPTIQQSKPPTAQQRPFITQWLSVPGDSALTETVHNLALLHQQSADDVTLADAYRDLGNRYRDQPQQSIETLAPSDQSDRRRPAQRYRQSTLDAIASTGRG